MSEWNAETAEWYAKKYGDYPTNRLGIDELSLLDNSVIVDIGCGTGTALRYAALKIAGGIFIGVDPVPRMVEIANDMTLNHKARNQIEFRVGSAESLPVDDNIADFVLAFDSIDHWQDIDKGLIEVTRILHADGALAIVKDKSLPGAKQALENLSDKLNFMGYSSVARKEISKEGVSFYFLLVKTNK